MLFLEQFKKAPKRKWMIPLVWIWCMVCMVILLSAAVGVSIGVIDKIVNGQNN